jgi:probable phosphoglycerate mutase
MATTITTHLLRHGHSHLNRVGLLNGDPRTSAHVDDEGRAQAHTAASQPWASGIASVVTSSFLRARETADAMLGASYVERRIDPRLDEIDYGEFEGRSWSEYGSWLREHGPEARPNGAGESWAEAMDRVLDALVAACDLPPPRVVIGHGFWIAAVCQLIVGDRWPRVADIGTVPWVTPTTLSDAELRRVVGLASDLLDRPRATSETWSGQE